jgi:hypothetical protein
MILQSLIIGSSFLLALKNSSNNLFLNSYLSFVVFWSVLPFVKLVDNLLRANNFLIYLSYFCYLIFVFKKIKRQRIYIFALSSTTYFLLGSFLNFQIRGGDSYLSTLGVVSLAFPNEVNFDLSMFAHRPVLLSLIESLSLVSSNSLFFFFFQFSSILLIFFIIFVFYSLSKNYLLSVFLLLIIISTPAVFLLSIYYEVHSFLALQLVTLIYLFIHEDRFVKNQIAKDFIFSMISFSIILSRFEAILFLIPVFYLYNKKNKLKLSYRLLISSSSVWYLSLYLLGYDYKSADKLVFLILGVGVLISIFTIPNISPRLISKSGLLLLFLNIVLLVVNKEFNNSMFKLFNILTGNQAFWGTIGVMFFGLILYQTIFSVKKEMFLITILPFWTMNLLTFVSGVETGWRYGLSSSANRLLFTIFFIALLSQILVWKNDKIFTS